MPVYNFFHYDKNRGPTLEETGPLVQVSISLPKALEEFYSKKGIPIPAPIPGYALIDTGASASAVHEEVLTNLGILPIDSIPTHTPHGAGRSFVYPARISFPAMNISEYRMDRLIGSDLKWQTSDGREVIMLLGRDLLRYFLLIYNGLLSDITLSY